MQKPPGRPPVVAEQTLGLQRDVRHVPEQLPVLEVARLERIRDVLQLLERDVYGVQARPVSSAGDLHHPPTFVPRTREREVGFGESCRFLADVQDTGACSNNSTGRPLPRRDFEVGTVIKVYVRFIFRD